MPKINLASINITKLGITAKVNGMTAINLVLKIEVGKWAHRMKYVLKKMAAC